MGLLPHCAVGLGGAFVLNLLLGSVGIPVERLDVHQDLLDHIVAAHRTEVQLVVEHAGGHRAEKLQILEGFEYRQAHLGCITFVRSPQEDVLKTRENVRVVTEFVSDPFLQEHLDMLSGLVDVDAVPVDHFLYPLHSVEEVFRFGNVLRNGWVTDG